MKSLDVSIEIHGKQVQVGYIEFDNIANASFRYDEEYLKSDKARPISISLPLQQAGFSPEQTKIFFEGLLPEGFTRKSVAKWMHVDENDYLSLLFGLGQECLGAVRISNRESVLKESYELLEVEQVRELAAEGATKSAQLVTQSHLSLTGASGKVGLYYDSESKQWYQPVGNAPSTHIVKQSHIRLNGIVTNEQLCLLTGKYLGIKTPDSFIVNIGNAKDPDVLFATERYDRRIFADSKQLNGLRIPHRLHQEDFAQAMGIASVNKYENNYEGYLKGMLDVLRKHSANPIDDQMQLWRIIVFDYLVGNTDNHIKNYSLLYDDMLNNVRLAPAYDIVSTTIYESSTRNMAFNIGGEYSIDKIRESHFMQCASEIGIGQGVAKKCFMDVANAFEKALKEAQSELVEKGFLGASEICEKILHSGGYGQIDK